MSRDPFPSPPGDAGEPDGWPLPVAGEDGPEDGLEDGWEGPAGQGLFVTLPAEQVSLPGFAQGGASDTMAPGPLLAAVVGAVTGEDGAGVAGLSDDQLTGIIAAARRLESRAAWTLLAAVAEFAARHLGASLEDQFAADELAAELHLTPLSAAGQMEYAGQVAGRLPGPSPRWPPGRSTRSTSASSRTRPASCPTRTPPRLMRSWRRPRPG